MIRITNAEQLAGYLMGQGIHVTELWERDELTDGQINLDDNRYILVGKGYAILHDVPNPPSSFWSGKTRRDASVLLSDIRTRLSI